MYNPLKNPKPFYPKLRFESRDIWQPSGTYHLPGDRLRKSTSGFVSGLVIGNLLHEFILDETKVGSFPEWGGIGRNSQHSLRAQLSGLVGILFKGKIVQTQTFVRVF